MKQRQSKTLPVGVKTTRVYSYIRFSSDEQRHGDSVRRQIEWRDRFMRDNPEYLLDTSIKLMDEGRSAYKDEHRKKGALGVFLKHVEQGNIPSGSILLVESMDRLTRLETFDALEMLSLLIKHGIKIRTQIGYYDKAEMNNGQIHGLIAEIQRSHFDSKQKGMRVRGAWQRAKALARENGTPFTKKCPEWLELKAKKYHIIPPAVTTIQLIFDWKLQGLSQHRMEARLNAEASWKPLPRKKEERERGESGNGWRTSYIKKILSNRAVIGEYQPYTHVDGVRMPDGEPMTNHYPSIIARDVFFAVQKQLADNKGKGGRADKKWNLFTHIIKCGYCSGPMHFHDKSNGWRYLVCDHARRKVLDDAGRAICDSHPVRYAEVQDLVLESCQHLRPDQVIPSSREYADKLKVLQQRIKAHEGEMQALQSRINILMEDIEKEPRDSIRATYRARHQKHDSRQKELAVLYEQDQRELSSAKASKDQFESWQTDLTQLKNFIAGEAVDVRLRLAALLRDYIARIEVFAVGFKVLAGRDSDGEFIMERGEVVLGSNGRKRRRPSKMGWKPHVETIIETIADFWDSIEPKPTKKERAEFERYLLARRMSKEGRFYRIRFKNGERFDLVPSTGLATGWRVLKESEKSVEMVLPDIGSLLAEFRGENKHQKRRRT